MRWLAILALLSGCTLGLSASLGGGRSEAKAALGAATPTPTPVPAWPEGGGR